MFQGGKDVCFTLKVSHEGFAHGRITHLADHLFDGYPFDHIRKMQIARPVDGSHPTYTDYSLDQIAVSQGGARLELLFGSLNRASLQRLRNLLCFQENLYVFRIVIL